MDNRELCLRLAMSESEHEVIKFLTLAGYWNNPSKWQYYGNNENNFSTIGNQQSRPEAALVEKVINSVDAVLMDACLSQGISPESPEAPQSIQEALIRFFGIHDGKLTNILPKERTALADNICLVATGAKTSPCYIIIDRGEGQTPVKMPDTLLSINRANKLRIPFVQGKFNMGGTGVLQFCGKHNLQLIISRRSPLIAANEKDDSKDMWGFTMVRREDPTGGMRSSAYKYLCPSGQILAFESEGLPLLPRQYPEALGQRLEWGTFIKLFEYQMTGLKTNILFDLYNRLSILMPNVALPVRFYERRKGYTGHSMETTMSGLSVRLDEDRSDNLEDGFPTSCTISVQGQKMKASIFAFKRGKSDKYTKDEGILFTINGQTHAHLSRAFFSRSAVGMGYLEDSILVAVDCSDIEGRSREDLFMNSRDRLRSGDLRSELEHSLEDLIKNHTGLRELRERRKREEIENKLDQSKPLADVLNYIMKKSPSLSKLFIEGTRLSNPFNTTKTDSSDKFKGKKYPTFFTIQGDYTEISPKPCPINVRCRIQFKTDAVNDYFNRDHDAGRFTLKLNGEETENYTLNLWNGTATLNLLLPEETLVDEILCFESIVEDSTTVEPFESRFCVKAIGAVDKRQSKPGTRKLPSGNGNGNEAENHSKLALPEVYEVRRAEWEKHSFDKESALKVVNNGEGGHDFFINMDNIYLLTEAKCKSSSESKILEARFKYGMTLIGLALLKDSLDEKNVSEDEAGDICHRIKNITRNLSPILLPMISSLSDLEVEEAVSYQEESASI